LYLAPGGSVIITAEQTIVSPNNDSIPIHKNLINAVYKMVSFLDVHSSLAPHHHFSLVFALLIPGSSTIITNVKTFVRNIDVTFVND
jgi:hypothetical protein